MDDEWFIEQFGDLKERLTRIEAKADQTNGNVTRNAEGIVNIRRRVRKLEDSKLVKDTEDKFHKKHPYVTAGGVTIGGMSVTTFIIVGVKFIIENWPG